MSLLLSLLLTYFTPCSSASVVNSEHVVANWNWFLYDGSTGLNGITGNISAAIYLFDVDNGLVFLTLNRFHTLLW